MFLDPKPVVECSFITEFEDHTLVAMDAEVILFLHDLIASYIREKDKGRFHIECSFITEFEDHTLVAMGAEVILFLHDLIASYIREKDKGRLYVELSFILEVT